MVNEFVTAIIGMAFSPFKFSLRKFSQELIQFLPAFKICNLIEVRDSGALKNHKFRDQADALSKNIKQNAKDIFDKINTPENRNWLEQIWHSITSFFSHLFGGLIVTTF